MSSNKAINYLKSLILLCLLGSLYSSIYGQNWPKVYGDSYHSLFSDIIESYDEGYILAAYTYNNQGVPEYGWIIKTDINGNILWDKKFGNGIYMNGLSNLKYTNDNGLIITGATSKFSSFNDFDPLFLKINVCGDIEWCQVLKSPDDNYGIGIVQLGNGSFIGLLKYYGGDPANIRISLVKMDQTGEPIWIQHLAQEDTLIYNEEGYYLYLTLDSNYLVSGECFHPAIKPFWIKADTTGNQILLHLHA